MRRPTTAIRFSFPFILTLSLLSAAMLPASAQEIPTPDAFFGFRMGAEGKLAHWDDIVEYFNLLASRSDRLEVRELGRSTLDHPFILAIFSAPGNLANLEHYRDINKKLADPRGLSEDEIEALIQEGKYVSAQSYSLHATEVGGTQSTPELAYELVTSDDPTITMILENTIFLMFPSFNPDGEIMVTEWFRQYADTPYSNTRLPYLYHFYTGHDNNRDAYMLTQDESRLFAEVVYRDWVPESYVDHHHMGSGSARFYLPPYLDPLHPNVSPLIWREHQLYGSHMAVALEQAGKSGFETGAPYTGWWQASFHMATNYHNIAGMLTESASADWADPVYILPDELGGTRGRPSYEPAMSMPRPWPGGWWTLRDIVEQQIVATKAVLEAGARYRESLLRNMVLKARENVRLGQSEPPYAYILPADQHDFPTAVKLARTFQMNGVEVQRLDAPYQVGSRVFAPGSLVISTAQPMRAFVKSFLEQVNYPDNQWTRAFEDHAPLRPYDMASYSMSEQMGVDAIPVLEPLRAIRMSVVEGWVQVPAGSVDGAGSAYLLRHDANESLRAVNRLLAQGFTVEWMEDPFERGGAYFPPGTMLVSGGGELEGEVRRLSSELGLDFQAASPAAVPGSRLRLAAPRLGLYKRFDGGSQDAGWTDWLLSDWEFEHDLVMNEDMRAGRLNDRYDVLILPSDNTSTIIEGDDSEETPPEYRGGIGEGGVAAVRTFVENGGTLITLNSAWDFVREVFDLPLRDAVADVPGSEFWCPGSTLHIDVDTSHPLAYGMPARALALFFRGTPSLRVSTGDLEDGVKVVARYADENLLQSGWLIGEDYLTTQPLALEFDVGRGRVLVLGFPAQNRAQTHGTFKFLFNGIFYGAAEHVGNQTQNQGGAEHVGN